MLTVNTLFATWALIAQVLQLLTLAHSTTVEASKIIDQLLFVCFVFCFFLQVAKINLYAKSHLSITILSLISFLHSQLYNLPFLLAPAQPLDLQNAVLTHMDATVSPLELKPAAVILIVMKWAIAVMILTSPVQIFQVSSC